jgi:hypothetical protein
VVCHQKESSTYVQVSRLRSLEYLKVSSPALKVVKYLYKYIFKGTDRATMRVDGNVDEIKTHVDGRYLSPPESAWHIYKFCSHEEYPPVQRLALHLPNEQPVYFDEDASRDDIRDRMQSAGSSLIAFLNTTPSTRMEGISAIPTSRTTSFTSRWRGSGSAARRKERR